MIDEVLEKYGEQAVENLFDDDWKSYHLDAEVMSDPVKQKLVLKELEKLNEKLGFSIFTTGSYKIKENFVDRLRTVVKTNDEFNNILEKSKLVVYISKASLK